MALQEDISTIVRVLPSRHRNFLVLSDSALDPVTARICNRNGGLETAATFVTH